MKDHALNWLSRESSEIEPLTPQGAQLLAIQPRTMAQAFAAVMALTLTPISGAQGSSNAQAQTPQSQSAAEIGRAHV